MPRAADHGDALEAFLFRLPQRFAHVRFAQGLPAAPPVRRVRVWALRPAAWSWLRGWRRTAQGRRCAPRPYGSTTPRRRRIRRRVRASQADRRKRPPDQTPHPRRFRPYRPHRRLQAVRGPLRQQGHPGRRLQVTARLKRGLPCFRRVPFLYVLPLLSGLPLPPPYIHLQRPCPARIDGRWADP